MAGLEKKAVILFNLGGPDAPESIEPFLINFFTDPNIIRLPRPFRYLLARWIAWRRTRREAGESYGMLGGSSPLLENTLAQARALEQELAKDKASQYKVFVCMRYWHPMAEEVAAQVKDFDPAQIVLLPLYPQYSTTTTRSSFQTWQKAAAKVGLEAPTKLTCCYPTDDGFVQASADLIAPVLDAARKEAQAKNQPAPRLLFSAHGLPESVIRDGDPYQWQCEQGAEAIAQKLSLAAGDWTLCYQSRVGPKKWIGPDTDSEVLRAGKEQRPLVIYPLAFVNEHVETLVEIEEEYRDLAEENGVPAFHRVLTVGVSAPFIEGLAAMVRAQQGQPEISGAGGEKICPGRFRRCCMAEFSCKVTGKEGL